MSRRKHSKAARAREVARRAAAAREEVRLRLDRALADAAHVRVLSRHRGADPVEGFVVALGQRWAVLALIDHAFRPDGWAFVRLRDVAAVERQKSTVLAQRILTARGQWPLQSPDGIAMDRARELTDALVSRGDLVQVHVEGFDADSRWVGTPVSHVDGELELHEINARGAWSPRPTFFDVKAVTRYTLGNGYGAALALAAGTRSAEGSAPRATNTNEVVKKLSVE